MKTKQPRKKQVKRVIKAFITLYEGRIYKPMMGDFYISKRGDTKEQNSFIDVPCTITYQLPRPKVK